jgi:chitinase
MTRLTAFVATCCLLAGGVSHFAAASSPVPLIVGYVFPQDAILAPGQIDPHSMTRINYAFANIADGRMVTGFSHDAENFATLNALKRANPSLTILVSVGGWLWSTNFSDTSLTRQSRDKFIQSVMDFLTLYKLDGLDIDWEYPGMVGSGHPFRDEDKRNFTLLLKELRSRFDTEEKRTHHRLSLTIAAGSSNEFLAHTEMSKLQEYLDTVNLMAYDYYEPGSDAITGHHAPLYIPSHDPKKISSDSSVQAFEQAGVPAAKILLGVPFYGHVWGHVADHEHGLFQAGSPVPKAYAPYSLIASGMLNHGYIRYWDASASVPYLYNSDTAMFISYEDPESLAAKCKYILHHHLGGVMFWDYSADPTGALLQSIHKSFQQPASGEAPKQ